MISYFRKKSILSNLYNQINYSLDTIFQKVSHLFLLNRSQFPTILSTYRNFLEILQTPFDTLQMLFNEHLYFSSMPILNLATIDSMSLLLYESFPITSPKATL